jgi:hypothetical protein
MISRLKEKIRKMIKGNSEYWKKVNQQDLAETPTRCLRCGKYFPILTMVPVVRGKEIKIYCQDCVAKNPKLAEELW